MWCYCFDPQEVLLAVVQPLVEMCDSDNKVKITETNIHKLTLPHKTLICRSILSLTVNSLPQY